MSDKQQPQQQQQQTATVLEQQQVQVQVQMAQQQQHDGSASQQAQQQAAGPPQHTVQVPHQQPGTPTGVAVVSSGVGGAQCVQVPTSNIQIQQQVCVCHEISSFNDCYFKSCKDLKFPFYIFNRQCITLDKVGSQKK